MARIDATRFTFDAGRPRREVADTAALPAPWGSPTTASAGSHSGDHGKDAISIRALLPKAISRMAARIGEMIRARKNHAAPERPRFSAAIATRAARPS